MFDFFLILQGVGEEKIPGAEGGVGWCLDEVFWEKFLLIFS